MIMRKKKGIFNIKIIIHKIIDFNSLYHQLTRKTITILKKLFQVQRTHKSTEINLYFLFIKSKSL